MAGSFRRAGLVWPTLLVVLGLAVLLGLGTWQVQRLHWKQGLISRIETRAKAAPDTLGAVLDQWRETGDIEYRRLRLRARFRHDRERHLYAIVDGRVGWRIVTPADSEGGRIVFVDRGFVPDALRLAASRAEGQPTGDVEVTGLARAPAEQGLFTPDNDTGRNLWYWRDLDGMAASTLTQEERTRLVPFFVEAEATAVPGGWPKGGVTRLQLSNRHLGYALTWYGLAAALLVVFGFFVRGRLKGE